MCRASVMKPDTNMSGNTTVHNKTCNDNTFSRKEAEGNGCRPCLIDRAKDVAAVDELRQHDDLRAPVDRRCDRAARDCGVGGRIADVG